jgi:hypothetical protein
MKASPPISTTKTACTLDDLMRSEFRIVAVRVEQSLYTDRWEYTMPAIEGGALEILVSSGAAITVSGKSGGQTVLYAKLAAR